MNGSTSANNWDNRWNQTGDLTWDGSKSLYTITGWGATNWSSDTFYPETLYVHGTLDEGSWDPSKGYQLEKKAEGVFSGTIIVVPGEGSNKGEFAFNEKNGDWNIIGGGARYGSISGSAEITSGAEVKLTRGSENFTVEIPAGETSVSIPLLVDLTTNTLMIDGEVTGIEEVGVDAGEAVYYNLQGVKVANPENGIFIKKQGNKTLKVVL